MEKVLRATDRAKTQAQRKLLAQRASVAHGKRIKNKGAERQASKDIYSTIITARAMQREDWLLGPVAPRRDVGSSKYTYGTITPRMLRTGETTDYHDYCIEQGDRVVVVGKEFRDRGKIGKVTKIVAKEKRCCIEGINLADFALPMSMRVQQGCSELFSTQEVPIPLSAVRLVYPLRNTETGAMRDVIINKLNRSSKREKNLGYAGRYIADSDPKIFIPFPEQPKPEYSDNECDTLRIEAEEKTWTPTLYQAPMPPSVLDELRNKYGIFRTRHDESWVRARERRAAELERERINKEKLMVTPLQDYHRMKKLEKSKAKEKTLDQKTLMGIGEIMARNRVSVSGTKEASG